ncbi:uncharacterized protein LOC122261935 [Penaeus japonicus]|uniref:uncharacterized protein LOC122261935 n=1 Tax=Penaeus japonicus TaxID=27405 RepID=UPI001C717425|nr:uncharacterized protein LOC122261935 [Penaeus japonicus]
MKWSCGAYISPRSESVTGSPFSSPGTKREICNLVYNWQRHLPRCLLGTFRANESQTNLNKLCRRRKRIRKHYVEGEEAVEIILQVEMFSISKIATRCFPVAQRSLSTTASRCKVSFEPPYLDAGGPDIPEFPLLNVQMEGYDFTVLEHYGKWVHRTALNMGIEVEDSWATPCQKVHIQTYKPRSVKIESEYDLQIYQRTVQLADIPSYLAPLFMEVAQAGLPEGVNLTFQEHIPEHTEVRYIPDLELKELRKQLDLLGGPSKTKK